MKITKSVGLTGTENVLRLDYTTHNKRQLIVFIERI